MHIWVVYESRLGNTAHIARVIADALSTTHRVRLVEAQQAEVPYHVDLIFIGYPLHKGRSPEAILAWLAKLPYNALKDTLFVVFDIRYRRFRICHRSGETRHLTRLLQQLGGRKAGNAQSFYLLGKGGPLSEGELRRAVRWAITIGERLSHLSATTMLASEKHSHHVIA